MNNKIRYTCACYKFAPESFKCYMVVLDLKGYNHSYFELKNFSKEENEKVGMTCITKGKQEAEAEIKRIIRKKNIDRKYITYGYKVLNQNIIAYLQYDRIDNNANILEKLKLYKKVKSYFKSQNYIITEYTLNSFELNSNLDLTNVKKEKKKQILNTKPIKIRFIRKG